MYEQASISKNVMKLFDKKLATFTVKAPEDLSRASIVTEIIKITIKARNVLIANNLDLWRMCSYMHIWKAWVSATASGNTIFEQNVEHINRRRNVKITKGVYNQFCSYVPTLLGEVMSSVAERCVDPTFLEQNIVDKIVQTSIDQFNAKQK